jgi:hypothetical protein
MILKANCQINEKKLIYKVIDEVTDENHDLLQTS